MTLLFLFGGIWVGGMLGYLTSYILNRSKGDIPIERIHIPFLKPKPVTEAHRPPTNEPKGEFIELNPVATYLKEHEGESIALGDIIENDI